MWKRLAYRISCLLRRRRVERELDEEIAFHIERETERNLALGMSSQEARRQAFLAFGGVGVVKEAHRDHRGPRWIEEIGADVRYAARTLRRNPSLSAAAILTFALAIGANTAIFSAVNAVLLQPLPFRQASRLVVIGEDNPDFGWHMSQAAPANYLDWRARVPAFQDAMAYVDYPQSATLLRGGKPELVPVASVTGNFFSVLGVAPELGRTFRDEETWSRGETETHLVVLSDALWRRQFGGDPAVIGTTISLDGALAQVVGVAPPGFAFPQPDVGLWMPMQWPRALAADVSFRRAHWLRVVARLRSHVPLAVASSQLGSVAAHLKTEYPATNAHMDAELVPLHRFLGGDTRLPLLVLLVSVALLLVIASANVANLLLVRAAAREREVALRAALGASRTRLVRQTVTESLVLAALGGVGGLGVGWAATRALVALEPKGMLRVESFGLDWAVFAYIALVTTGCGLLFGIAPAVWNARRSPNDALKAGSGGRTASGGAAMRRWGERLAIAEVAIALLLTVGAGLLVRSYVWLVRVNAGFDSAGIITAAIEVPRSRYRTPTSGEQFFEDLVNRVRALPGVRDAAAVTHLPLAGSGWSSDFSIEGPSAGHFAATLLHRQVTPDYFRTMRVPLLRGRWFRHEDRGPPYVVVINDVFARRYFRGKDPIGQRIAFDKVPDSTSTWRTIVGVVGSERQRSLGEEPEIEAFAPAPQESSPQMTLVARVDGEPSAYGAPLRRVVAELDPELAIQSLQTMSDVRNDSLARSRFLTVLLSSFGVIGLVLAIVGVYGVVAQLTRSRTREMGIRIALGAPSSAVRWLVVRRGVLLAVAGLAIGSAGALLATPLLSRLLYGVAPGDPATFVVVIAAILSASVLASWIPAARAIRLDPVMTLREE